ncbi:MFS transporter [Thalassobaculum sp.]|uniref:MFS transporter n=1 Tax=Thalassobaculum sp. TaxID=2022740 RepID=UPI0032EB0896
MTRLFAILPTILPGIVLMGVSLLMFAYVGYGEATRVYSEMRLERVLQLGATIQHSLNQFARSGLPLDQVTGFERRAQQLGEVDRAIHAVALTDARGATITCLAVQSGADASACVDRLGAGTAAFRGHDGGRDAAIAEVGGAKILRLPVADKFGTVGFVVLFVDGPTVRETVAEGFGPVFLAAGALFLLYALAQIAIELRGTEPAGRWRTPSFTATVLVMVVVLIGVLFQLYRQGVEGQAEGLARSMAARLAAATEIGVPISALSGIEEALRDYRRINPQIAAITLSRDGEILHRIADPDRVAALAGEGTLSFSQPVDAAGTLVLAAELPFAVVVRAMGVGARNFAALFFGCMLFATIFFRAVRARRETPAGIGRTGERRSAAAGLAILQPAYFLGILADSLVLSVLPEMSDRRVAAEGLSGGLVSLPFSLFFVGLTGALIPASILTERIDLRSLFLAGTAAVAAGLFMVGLLDPFWALCAGRALGGVGQGLLLIAVQAYAFEIVSSEERVRAAAAQVLGYNGGLIVGTGIGGLLAVFMDDAFFMVVAGGAAVLSLVYIRAALPSLRKSRETETRQSSRLLGDLGRVLAFPDFLALLALIGVASKFALAGVAIFAMPLVLHQTGYGDDEIGQALMVFAIVTYLVTAVAPRLVAAMGSTDRVLVAGMIALALGMAGLGLVTGGGGVGLGGVEPGGAGVGSGGWLVPGSLTALAADVQHWLAALPLPAAAGGVIALSVALLGVGQGLIAAPIIARVAAGGAAVSVGRDRTIAVYRILERLGHISGPALVGLLLVAASDNPAALAVLGGAYGVLAALYGLVSVALRTRPST